MTKIDIFSGFLGAGKTTLIKKLIKEAFQGEKLVLIENEFGEIGIDGGFMKDAGINVTEMNSGCICCSLVGDFGAALEEVLEKYHPDRIIIEPSGVGKLSDVIKAVSGVMESHDDMHMNGYVTVADATKCKMYMKNFGEFYNNQVESAKTIVLSRTGKITDEKLDAALALIREKNDKARGHVHNSTRHPRGDDVHGDGGVHVHGRDGRTHRAHGDGGGHGRGHDDVHTPDIHPILHHSIPANYSPQSHQVICCHQSHPWCRNNCCLIYFSHVIKANVSI